MRSLSIIVFLLVLGTTARPEQITSRNGEYYCVTGRTGVAQHYPENNHWTATVFTRNGEEIYRIERDIPFDVQYPSVHLADDGRCIVVHSFDGLVEFVDGGMTVATLSPFSDRKAELEQIIKCSVAGAEAFFLVSRPDIPRAEVLRVGLDGSVLARITLPYATAGEVFSSADGKYILATSYDGDDPRRRETVLLNVEGERLRSLPVIFRYADIDAAHDMAVISDRNDLFFFPLSSATAPEKWTTGGRADVITDVALVGGIAAAAVAHVAIEDGRPVYHDPSLLLFTQGGVVQRTTSAQATSDTPGRLRVTDTRVFLDAAGTRLTLPVPSSRK